MAAISTVKTRLAHRALLASLTCVAPASALAQAVPPCVPAPAGIVGWWDGEGDAADIVGTNHGSIQGSVTFTSGIVGGPDPNRWTG
jgi:hypothetical protein